ncbi:MAG: trypsin-like serine protease [Lachnospiraceae bacterium]|nr:trypsin-like serine protease [Lachnospiraceae bacterium]
MDNNNYYNNYNPYTNPNSQEERRNTTEHMEGGQPPRKNASLGTKIIRTIAIALVFGLVAGGVGLGIIYVGGSSLGIFQEASGTPGSDNDNVINPGKDNNGQSDSTNNDKDNGDSTNKLPVTDPIPETNKPSSSVVAIMDVSDLVKDAMPCIVAITNLSETYVQGMWGQGYVQESESCGTGFLVEQDNEYIYIATNNHVVDGAKELTVQFSDNAEVKAQIKGQVASKDLAVIKVALKDIPKETRDVIRLARLGDSNALEVGEGAIAIGNALGYGQSVTTGVVSALGRSVTVTDSASGTTIVNNNLIQTDAAINPGNSGGALFNVNGEVIGINSVKYSDTRVEGIGYAIPISDAMLVIEKLISGEQVDVAKAGYLGIQGVDSNYGVYVYKVFAGSAAEKAGLSVGDIIVEFEGNEISTMNQLKELLSYYAAGETVDFVIYKAKGNEYVETKVTVTLGDASTVQQ